MTMLFLLRIHNYSRRMHKIVQMKTDHEFYLSGFYYLCFLFSVITAVFFRCIITSFVWNKVICFIAFCNQNYFQKFLEINKGNHFDCFVQNAICLFPDGTKIGCGFFSTMKLIFKVLCFKLVQCAKRLVCAFFFNLLVICSSMLSTHTCVKAQSDRDSM